MLFEFITEGLMAGKAAYGGISSDAVKAKTGCDWDRWIKTLDRDKAYELPHKEIARLVGEKYKIGPWWRQMVTVGYEQAKGLRVAHQKTDGYSANLSRTMALPIEAAFGQWSDAKLRKKLTGAAKYKVTTVTPAKWVRLAFEDGSRVNVGFYVKGEGKCQVTIEHNKLASVDDVKGRKEYWTEVLERMKAAVA